MKIAIVIPCFNHGKYLLQALASTAPLVSEGIAEVVVINDGSTDTQTNEVIRDISSKGWTVLQQSNQGLANARNNGIRTTTAPYILPLDSDNYLIASVVRDVVRILDNSTDTDIVYTDIVHFGDIEANTRVGEFNPCRLIRDNYIDACAVFRRDVWEQLGGYDPNMPAMGHEDWDFWVRAMLNRRKFYYLEKAMFCYRVRHDSMLRTVTNPKLEQNREYIYAKHNRMLMECIRNNYNHEVESIKSSLSWRITAPLRWIGAALTRR